MLCVFALFLVKKALIIDPRILKNMWHKSDIKYLHINIVILYLNLKIVHFNHFF